MSMPMGSLASALPTPAYSPPQLCPKPLINPIQYQLVVKHTNELSCEEYHAIMKERIKVFVVEQQCPYQEIDDKDDDCIHIFFQLIDNSDQTTSSSDTQKRAPRITILAYTRIVSPQFNTQHDLIESISLGRVLVAQEYRNLHLGKQIVAQTIEIIKQLSPTPRRIKIGAQAHLQAFYGSFGFQPISEVYDEDGIPHIDMILTLQQ